MSSKQDNSKNEQTTNQPPYPNCLNCNTELNGPFCHKCGQEATSTRPAIGGFIMEYLNNAFMWDAKLISSLWYLVTRPGYLTSEFLAGKFIAHMHPLKLNMFILFVTITVFVLLTNTSEIDNAMQGISSNKDESAALQLELLNNDTEYCTKMKESPRDTVVLRAHQKIAEQYPELITYLEAVEQSKIETAEVIDVETVEATNAETAEVSSEETADAGNDQATELWRAVVPRILIEDKVIVADNDNCYSFNLESQVASDILEEIRSVWEGLKSYTSQYFPLIILLTTPFLAFSLKILQRKKRQPGINHFIFSLHYTSFLAVLIMFIYVLDLTISPSFTVLEWILILGSSVYLTMAMHRVYTPNSWVQTAIKALLTNIIYAVICTIVMSIAFIIVCINIILNTEQPL